MKKLIFSCIIILLATNTFCQDAEKKDENDKIFTRTEKAPMFPGGDLSFQRYLQRQLKVAAVAQYLKATPQTVKVQFLIDREGNVYHVQCLDLGDINPELGKEAVRFIKMGPKWIPAEQNGHVVVFQDVVAITFPPANQ